MKIYHLHIIKTEDTKKITDKTVFYKEEHGYYSCLENVKLAICGHIIEIEEDFDEYPEYIQTIYCDEIDIDVEFSDGYVLFFDQNGDLIKRTIYDTDPPKNTKFKIGDYVTYYVENGIKTKVGVITTLPEIDDVYTIYYSADNDYMDHTHINEDWLYKVEHVSDELKLKLDKTLKLCITDKEYQLLKREDKLNNILKK